LGVSVKKLMFLAACAVTLSGCGIASKMESVSILDASRAAYKACISDDKNAPPACDTARLAYQTDLADAERTRGVFTNWPAL
jgi:hypothetical protein